MEKYELTWKEFSSNFAISLWDGQESEHYTLNIDGDTLLVYENYENYQSAIAECRSDFIQELKENLHNNIEQVEGFEMLLTFIMAKAEAIIENFYNKDNE